MTSSLTTKLLVGSVLLSLCLPVLAGAQIKPNREGNRPAGLGANLCENLATLRANTLTRLTERADKVKGRQGNQASNFSVRKTERLGKLDEQRNERDGNRESRYESLKNRAQTDEQKEAVAEFSKTAEDLVDARRAAVDAAIADFEAGVAELKSERDTTTSEIKTKVESDIDDIFDAAEADCAAGGTPESVRAIIKAGMDEMRSSHQTRKEDYSFKTELETLRTERKAAFKAAQDTFKSEIDSAKAKLKEAFN